MIYFPSAPLLAQMFPHYAESAFYKLLLAEGEIFLSCFIAWNQLQLVPMF